MMLGKKKKENSLEPKIRKGGRKQQRKGSRNRKHKIRS